MSTTARSLTAREAVGCGLPLTSCCCDDHHHSWYLRTDPAWGRWFECEWCSDQRDPTLPRPGHGDPGTDTKGPRG